ncbi:uncharacterized protein LOC123267271 [Cotesia glomerata]|uniref:Uncharacterized protein n=1 Tax=Cotesia glomerata TaxID=32391 RepID=A0AAV7HVA4_COTGL|nr:uncharacterized protein LOC123267271 [Cotesia glomerata]KAH0534678.1 hypothetical protein KQX54_006618 [Cotesia glomerata]
MLIRVLVAVILAFFSQEVYLTPIISTTEQPEPEGYIELDPPFIRMLTPNKPDRILQKEDYINLIHFVKPNSSDPVLFEFVGPNGWSEILTDHQLHRMVDGYVIAIITSKHADELRSPGFGHSFLSVKNDGSLKYFKINLTLTEAIKKLPLNYPNNFVTSKFPYHDSFIEP